MTFLEYLGQLIPLEDMTPELQALFAGCFVIVAFRLIAGALVSWFEGMFK